MAKDKIKIADLRFSNYNPREVTERAKQALRNSIERWGLQGLVIVNQYKGREGIIVGGNMTVQVLKEMGWKEIPAKNIGFVNLPEPEEKALSLALNKIPELRIWDKEKIGEILADINRKSEIELTLTGLNEIEISDALDALIGKEEEVPEFEMEQKILTGKPQSKYGEIYELGKHKLMCGDATKIEDIKKLMAGKQADMVFTDPPYNVAHISHEKRKKFPTEKGVILGDQQSPEEFAEFTEKFFNNYYQILKPGRPIYICTGYTSYPLFYYQMLNAGFYFSSTLVWIKPNPTIGFGDYKRQYEQVIKGKKEARKKKAQPIIYGWKKGQRHFLEDLKWKFESDVWEMPRKTITKMLHPTEKPLWLCEKAIRNSSKRGDLIVDLFAGCGSTLIAAHKLERQCYAMELDPHWTDVIIQRWKKRTGEKVKKL